MVELIYAESKQILLLLKHFIMRFLYNDTLQFEDQRRENHIFWAAFLSVMGGFIAHQLLNIYNYLQIIDIDGLRLKTTTFFSLVMAVAGFICLILWDNMFLDGKDFMNLLPLPLKIRTLFLARILSILTFTAVITLTLNLFASLVFAFYLSPQPHKMCS